jgi:hypothetical protein
MDIKFVPADLRRLDPFVGELLVVFVPEDLRPPPGIAHALDFRLRGALSRLLGSGDFTGRLGETAVISPRPYLAFDRLLIMGAGTSTAMNPQIYAGLIDAVVRRLAEEGARRTVIELPGRALDTIAPELALDILLERAGDDPKLDTWTLVENGEVSKRLSVRLRRDRGGGWGTPASR